MATKAKNGPGTLRFFSAHSVVCCANQSVKARSQILVQHQNTFDTYAAVEDLAAITVCFVRLSVVDNGVPNAERNCRSKLWSPPGCDFTKHQKSQGPLVAAHRHRSEVIQTQDGIVHLPVG